MCFNPSRNVRLREFSKLEYGDPGGFLIALRKFEEQNARALSNTPSNIRNLRTNCLKSERERRDAALFCVGMSAHLGCEVRFAPVEDQDFDFVATWQTEAPDSTQHFCPVQLKELVPEHLSSEANLQQVFSSLEKYADSEDLVVAIKINRVGKFDLSNLNIPTMLKLGGIWVFGALSEDQTDWAIWGDLLNGEVTVVGLRYNYPMP